ncbi:hypothetical protein SAMN02745831_04942, partial [Streptomyces sp. PgraA7]
DFRCGALRRTDLRSSPERRASSLCGSVPRPGLQFGLLSWAFRWVRPSDAIPLAPRAGRLRTRPDPRTNGWKACWGQPLTSSNLVSSAIALTGQYVEGPRSLLRGPSTLGVAVASIRPRRPPARSCGLKPAEGVQIRRGEVIAPGADCDDPLTFGEETHIVARSKGGPRAEDLDGVSRDSHTHQLLCSRRHKQIDDQPTHFTVARLREIEERHAAWVRRSLNTIASGGVGLVPRPGFPSAQGVGRHGLPTVVGTVTRCALRAAHPVSLQPADAQLTLPRERPSLGLRRLAPRSGPRLLRQRA